MKQSEYLSLCARSLSGELSSEEKRDLETWLSLDPENRKIMDQVSRAWIEAEPQPLPFQPDSESGWRILAQALDLESPVEKARESGDRRIFARLPFLRETRIRTVAVSFAAVALVVAAVWTWKSATLKQDMKTAVTANRERIEIVLSDGSRVRMNSGSSLRYPDRFSGSAREVELSGEAFFDIARDGKPFSVLTDNSKSTVLGTRFNVRARDGRTSLIVEKGRVRFESRRLDRGVILAAGQMCQVGQDDVTGELRTVNADRLLGWLKGRLVFDKMPVSEIIGELERTFGASIEVKGVDLARKTVTAEFDEPSFETVLSSLCLTLDAEYRLISGHYIIQGR